MKKLLIPFVLLAMIMLVGSCSSSKHVAYFQNIDSVSLAASRGLYDARIMPKDQLTITVLTSNPEVSAPFNLSVSSTVGPYGQLNTSNGSLQEYLVDNDGNINFPIVGKLHVAGLTKGQCEDLIVNKVKPFLNEKETPIVTVRLSSFHVTVIGEVGSPKVIPVSSEKISIIEALASAGDLGIYGKRNNVLLIREDANGEKKATRIDLNDANLFNSPYYYLQQNDIVYVEPNSVKAKDSSISNSTTLWFSFIGIVTSVASLLVNILR